LHNGKAAAGLQRMMMVMMIFFLMLRIKEMITKINKIKRFHMKRLKAV